MNVDSSDVAAPRSKNWVNLGMMVPIWDQMQVLTEQNFDITFHSALRARWSNGYKYQCLNTHFSLSFCAAYNLVIMLTFRILNNSNNMKVIIKMFWTHLQVKIVQQPTQCLWANFGKRPWRASRHGVTSQDTHYSSAY